MTDSMLEQRSDWKEMVDAAASQRLVEVAAAFDVPVVDLVTALRRAGIEREAVRSPEPTPSAPAPKARAPKRGRRTSRVDAYASLVGQVPDRVVAERAGVTIGAVRNWRVARGIPAAGRLALPPEPGDVAEALAAPAAAAVPRRRPGRRSRIDPFRDEVGQVPDRVIAEKAGVTVNAVANYRKVRSIPGYGTVGAVEAPVAAPPASGATAAPAPVVVASASGLAREALQADAAVRTLHRQLAERYDPGADARLRELLATRDALVIRLGQAALAHLAGGGALGFGG